MKRLGKISCMVAAITIMGCWSVPALAQTVGDGGIPTANPGTQQTQQPTQQPTTFEQGQQGDFQTGGEFDFQNLVDQLTLPEIPEFENLRVQPFVGRSLQRFEELGIQAHPRSNAETPGGVFSSGSGSGRGGVGGGRAGNNRQQGLQGGASNNIVRKSLRTRLVPKIVVRNPVTAQQVSTRFQQRISSSQNFADGATGVRIRVENKTAYLTGVVTSQDERDRVERMARLEPGIYRIDNKIQVQP